MSSTWSRAPRILTFFVARVISIERICRRWPRKWEWNRRSFFTTGLSVRKKWSSLLALQTFTLLPTGMRRRWFPERLLLPWERARPSFRLHIGTPSNCWTTVGARWFHFKIPTLLHKRRSNSWTRLRYVTPCGSELIYFRGRRSGKEWRKDTWKASLAFAATVWR